MSMTITQSSAVLFDLDGVLVPTVRLHKQAWAQLFKQTLPASVEPYQEEDYYQYVDGKPRYDGVASLLKSRGVNLPWGSPTDGPDDETICGLGNRKNAVFEQLLSEEGIQPYPDTVDLLEHLMGMGIHLAVVSSSRNTNTVLRSAGIRNYFEVIVDGNIRAQEGLKGKPAPDTYSRAADLLGLNNSDCVVVEDALSGVAAGRAGNFGLVVGVDRGVGASALLASGADMVVSELVELIEGSAKRTTIYQKPDLDEGIYPIDPWALQEEGQPRPESATLLSVSNGNLGIRANGDPNRSLGSGTFMSGFHDTYAIKHAEGAYGYARVGQVIQGVPDACGFTLRVDGKLLGEPESTTQRLDFRAGISATRSYYRLEDGAMLAVEVSRMACLFDPALAVCSLRLQCQERDLEVEVEGRINAEVPNAAATDDPRKSQPIDGCGIHEVLDASAINPVQGETHVYRCNNSQLTMAMAVRQYLYSDKGRRRLEGDVWHVEVHQGQPAEIERYAAYQSFPLVPRGITKGLVVQTEGEDIRLLVERCYETLNKACDQGLDQVSAQQESWLEEFWQRADIVIDAEDDGRIQQVTRWELFQLAQATAHITNGIGAKGLSGLGYDGHYFWDTEIYILPFLVYTDPERARKALHYRYMMLPAARRRAAIMNLSGALFPWRTIDGEEGSAYFPTGTAQYHIDGDIAYSLAQYVQVSGDDDYLAEEGIDILVETARMWLSLGSYQSDGCFHIHCVTGPDEYTAMVDDNLYTNQMARFNLQSASMAAQSLAQKSPTLYDQAKDRLGFDQDEIERWGQASEAMFMPYAQEEGVHAQDAQFMSRPEWDFEHFTARPLLLHYHPLAIYGHRVLKQTDVVMALYLLSSWFSLDQKLADFDYYDPLTTGDSTLSAASQSIIAAEVGHDDLAMRYFMESLFADVCNLHANTADGIHLAAAGGAWMTLVGGFGGLRDTGGTRISLQPRLPKGWKSMTYHLSIKGSLIRVELTQEAVELYRISGPELEIEVNGEMRLV
ncbi:kojibiose phosphorylase [Bombiscardovia apis]|uniref:Kojibiose phosphorylase n=1 Tax=Bombiscardovia apis TaxID=2932182 RepID=A0ABN6SIZ0_9BIFI|nr:beta-phosphoglucomutase family hydrolase [Bombiscardovia apis]BDR55293.1 kojibiose phosphorylase [Bombiscardovia apis]